MSTAQSSLEALILGIPAVGMLFAGFFRLDEVISRPARNGKRGHPLSHRDEDGNLVFIEPDGRYSPRVREGSGKGLALRKPGHLPRRGGPGRARHISVSWDENDPVG